MRRVSSVASMALTLAILGGAIPGYAGGPDGGNPVNAMTSDDFAKDSIVVKFRKEVSTNEVDTLLLSLGVSRDKEFSQLGLTTLKVLSGKSVSDLVRELSKNDRLVEYAEPDYRYSVALLPDDTSFNSLWGMNNTGQTGGTNDADIDAPEAWDTVTGNDTVVVAVIDTGVDYTHPDLDGNIWTNPAEIAGNGIDDDGNGYVDDIHGINTISGSGDPMDDNSHGTHVSGTIGGEGNNTEGVAGVNWNVSIMGVKFLDAGGSGFLSDAIEGLEYILAMKQAGVNIRVTNNSWGGGGFSAAMKDAFDAVGMTGTLHAVAAGNANYNNDVNPSYPSSYDLDSIISVGATDHNDNRSSFSQWGPTSVDLGAPGSSILSTVPGNGYDSYSGTSMATPHVAGAVALVAANFPAMSSAQIKSRLLSTVDVKSQLLGKWVSNGRLNISSAINCDPGNPVMSVSLADGFTANQNEDTIIHATLSDCDTISGASVYASFSNGDAQINLLDDGIAPDLVAGDGTYSGAWVASGIGSTTVSFTSTNPTLSASVNGSVVERIVYSKTTDYPYSWVDISTTGIPLGLSDDDSHPITFSFDFYGVTRNDVSVTSNGALAFDFLGLDYINGQIPESTGGGSLAFIAPFWDDLNPTASGEIYYDIQGSRLIVQWDNIPHFGSNTGVVTFQLILDQSNGDILMQYQDVDFGEVLYDSGASATVGLQQDYGYGQQHSYNEASINDGQAILWSLGSAGSPDITSPAAGATLAGSSHLFNWQSNGANVDEWWLYAGSATGDHSYFDSGSLSSNTSVTVDGLPTNGSTVFVRLWYKIAGTWQHLDEQYIAASNAGTPAMVSPVPESVLTGTSEAFSWEANGVEVDEWWIYAGSVQGSHNYFNSGNLGSTLNTTVTGIPTDGSTVYVRLFYKVDGEWLSLDEQYTASSVAQEPLIVSPEPGSVLSGDSVTFDWDTSGLAVDAWWIYAGSTVGAANYYTSGNLGSATSDTATGLPTDGSTVYIRLWYKVGTDWLHIDEQYTAANYSGIPAINSPVPGSVLSGSSAVFNWQDNGASVDAWWINAGSVAGSASYYSSGNLGENTTATVAGLPTNGSTIYIRLWYKVGSEWLYVDELYTSGS